MIVIKAYVNLKFRSVKGSEVLVRYSYSFRNGRREGPLCSADRLGGMICSSMDLCRSEAAWGSAEWQKRREPRRKVPYIRRLRESHVKAH